MPVQWGLGHMAKGTTLTFTHPDAYAGELGDARVTLTITGAGAFAASLTKLQLPHLQIFRCKENTSRIAFIALPPEQSFLSFPIGPHAPIFGNLVLGRRELLLYGAAERVHQRSTGACQWGMIAFSSERLAKYSKALTGRMITPSAVSRVFQPERAEALAFRNLFRQACRITKNPEFMENSEIARALEQEIFYAIIHCLTVQRAGRASSTVQHHTAVMARFEEILHNRLDEKIAIPQLCAELEVPDRTLRMCCAEHLGISPTRYILLLRLNKVRAALLRGLPTTSSVSEVARKHQFMELGRFSVTYRTVFGESPSMTLQRHREAN